MKEPFSSALLKAALEDGREPVSVIIVYDGQCIFCDSFVKLMRLRETVGPLLLLDARVGDVAKNVSELLGLDLNEGMLVLFNDRVYYGADAVHVLANLTTPSDLWNGVSAAIFRRAWLSRLLYPALKLGRRITLHARGRQMIRLTEEGEGR